MEGRVQGDPRPTERPPVRLTVVVASVFLAALGIEVRTSAVLPGFFLVDPDGMAVVPTRRRPVFLCKR